VEAIANFPASYCCTDGEALLLARQSVLAGEPRIRANVHFWPKADIAKLGLHGSEII
jgi:hypothetical protein